MTISLHLAVPPGQVVTDADMQQAQQITAEALAWWTAHDPAHPTFAPQPLDVISVPQPGVGNWALPLALHPTPPGAVSVWLYLNRDPPYMLPGVHGALAGMTIGRDVLALLYLEGPWSSAALLAHELGHAIYGLPDWYLTDPSCTQPDLMCNPWTSYPAGWLGCRSLAWIGGVCKRIWAPIIEEERGQGSIPACGLQMSVQTLGVHPAATRPVQCVSVHAAALMHQYSTTKRASL